MKKTLLQFAALAACLSGALTACNNDDTGGGNVPLKNIGITVSETTKTSTKAEFVPSNEKSGYYCNVIEKSIFDSYASDEAFIGSVFDYFRQTAGSDDAALSEFIARQIKTGTQPLTFDKLKPGTQYIAYAFGLTTKGKATSSLFRESFSTVVQSPSDNELAFVFSNTTARSVQVSITAANDDPYVFDIREASAFEGKNDEQILAMMLEASPAEELAQKTYTGSVTVPGNDLKPDTDYMVLAFGYEAGIATTTLASARFYTMPEQWTIGVEVLETTKNTVTVHYTPSSDKPTYYGIIIDKAYFDDFATDEEYIQDDLDFFKMLAIDGDKSLAEIITERTVTGEQRLPFKGLKPNTEYVAYAFGVNTDGTVTSGLFKKFFTTPKPEPSDNRLTLTVSKIGIDGALIEAVTTNSDPYILDVWEASKLAGKTDQEIMEAVVAAYGDEDLDKITVTGDMPLDVTGRLLSDTGYIALAFGYEAGVFTTALTQSPFTTKPGDWVDCTFTIEKGSLTSRTGSFTVRASDDTTPFFFSRISEDELTRIGTTDEALFGYLMAKVQEEADGFGYPLETYLKLLLFRESKTEDYLDIKPESEFRIVAGGISQQGKLITGIALSDKFTAPGASAATVTFSEPVIDATTVTVIVTPGAGTPKWKGSGMGYSSTYMSDEDLFAHLLSDYVGENKASYSFTYSDYDDYVYFYAVGLDADGNPGQLVKLTVPVN